MNVPTTTVTVTENRLVLTSSIQVLTELFIVMM